MTGVGKRVENRMWKRAEEDDGKTGQRREVKKRGVDQCWRSEAGKRGGPEFTGERSRVDRAQ